MASTADQMSNGHQRQQQDEHTIYHTIINVGESLCDKDTLQSSEKFEKDVQCLEEITSGIFDSGDSDNGRPGLEEEVKLTIRKRVNNKTAEVAQTIFRGRILDPDNKEELHKMSSIFKRFAAALRKAKRGCVHCYLEFADDDSYDIFWRGYSDGSLSDTLTRELITDDMRAAEGGADLYIHVRVLDSATEDGDFSDQDPSGTAGRGPPHPGPSREHSGQGPPAPCNSNHGDDTSPGYHGDDTGGRQVSGGDDVIHVKQEPAEQVPSCCMMGTVKSEMDTNGLEVKEESELDRQFAAIADHLGSMWERLASSLGFNTDYIRDLTARLPPSLRPHQLICDWMERNAGDVTLEQLVQALRDAGIHEVADAADSGQLFLTEADLEAAKGKPDGDIDTGRADGEDSSNDRSSHDSQTSALASDGSHGNMEGEPMSEEDDSSRSSNSDTDDVGSGASSLPATCISTGIETNLPDDNVLLGDDTFKDCHTSEASGSRPAAGDVEDPAEAEVSAEKHTQDHGQAEPGQPDKVQKTVAGTPVDAHKNQIPESSTATGICTSCKQTMQPEYRYTCSTCENYNLCVVCYKKKGHSHKMQWGLQPSDVDTLQPSLSYHEARRQSIERCIQSLVHACQCRDTSCSQPRCQKMKRLVLHTKSCKRKANGGCPICKQLIALCCYHAKHCQQQKCPVPFCVNIKHKLQQQQLQQRLQQAQMLRQRMATIDKALHEENVKGTHVQVNMPQCTFTSTLYPTGEDALAWNDCIEDFFKTDEFTTRSIQQSWPNIQYNSINDESLPTIAAWLKVRTDVKRVWLRFNRFSAEGVRDFVRTMKGKAYTYTWSDDLLYDGSQTDVCESLESGGEDVRREEEQWERLRREESWIRVKE
ncbi:uncharacterized protein LOC118408375 [Branchiostoma floridae]|uniref:histone acetyltransferase n=1 Tax=Branchiostoma floridae TaxID=7739 RepID=A0A9J7KLK0_BRAFL|nr:uncharacterized protein LOC118408375 [Branchiostoma floridae]